MNAWLLMIILIAVVLAVSVLVFAVIFCGSKRRLEDRLMSASACVRGYERTGTGRKLRRWACATAFERKGDIYRFIAAAHCLDSVDDIISQEIVISPWDWFITFDGKRFYRASLVAVGSLSEGDDMAVFEAEISDREVFTVPLSDEDPYCGEQVLNVATPHILIHHTRKIFFRGDICSEPFKDTISVGLFPRRINWKNAVYCQLPVGGGSSGSLLVSCEREAVVAILVGTYKATDSLEDIAIALPVSQFKKFWKSHQDGTYEWPVRMSTD